VVSPVERPTSSPPISREGPSLLVRFARLASLLGIALLSLLATGDDFGGAPTKPTSEFHFVRMFYRDGALSYGFRYGGNRSWTVDCGV
jgi:hypothetical protein